MSERKQGISEILHIISGIKDPKQRQDALGTCASITPLVQVLKYIFDPNIKFDLPEGLPPFKKMVKSQDSQGTLYREARTLYLYIEGQANIPPLKKQAMFIQLLEALDPDDAELISAMKDKKIPYKNITYDLVYKTFPGLLPDISNKAKDLHDEDVLELTNIVSEVAVAPKKGEILRECPFGCASRKGSKEYLPGPLARHLKSKHPEYQTTG